MAKRKKAPPPSDADEEPDLISGLPMEVIHDILYRLNSSEEAARTVVLSKIWYNQFWRCYPVVEYRGSENHIITIDYNKGASRFKSFAAATSRRLISYHIPNRSPLTALRISLRLAGEVQQCLAELLKLTSSLCADCGSPREVSIEFCGECTLIQAVSPNCNRTEVLNLAGCGLSGDFGSFLASNARNLKFLCLKSICGIEKLEIRDDGVIPNLKTLELDGFNLKVLSASAAPNLKNVRTSNRDRYTQQDLDELTCNLQSLEYLSFHKTSFGSGHCSLGLSAPPYKLRELSLVDCFAFGSGRSCWEPLEGVRIDAPNLSRLYITNNRIADQTSNINVVRVASDFRFVVGVKSISRARFLYSSFCDDFSYEWFVDLRKFIMKFSWYFQDNLVLKLPALENYNSKLQIQPMVRWNSIGNSLVVHVGHLEFEASRWTDCEFGKDGHLLDGFFSICRPKTVTILRNRPINSGRESRFIEYMCRHLMKEEFANCCDGANCWRHFLRDAKIKSNGGEMIEISDEVISSIVEGGQTSICIALTW